MNKDLENIVFSLSEVRVDITALEKYIEQEREKAVLEFKQKHNIEQ